MKKIIAFVILSALMLAGCEKNPVELTEASETAEAAAQVSETSKAAESTSAETTSVTTETESEASETTETEPPYIEDGKPPVVMSAEELYDTYPVKLIYPERQDVSDKVKTEVLQEDFYTSNGLKASEFYAEYPILAGYDESVCKKINDTVKAFIDENYNDEKSWVESYEFDKNEIGVMEDYGIPIRKHIINMDGTYFDGFGYDINENIFSVYFADNNEYFQAAHGSENPVPMMFDLRTGDKIIFSELIGEKDKMWEVFGKAEYRGELLHGTVPFGERNADEISEFMKPPFYATDTFYTDEKIAVMDGCIGFILAPYEGGSFADGVRFWRLPASEFVPYMNDEGKVLFEGYISAETTAPKVIEYKGKRWFDNVEWIPEFIDRENLTEYDREFIMMFENARNADYYLNNE